MSQQECFTVTVDPILCMSSKVEQMRRLLSELSSCAGLLYLEPRELLFGESLALLLSGQAFF